MARVVGIDLGTTFSEIAVLEGGEPMVIPNAEGSRITPSVVAFTKEGERLVGEIAKRQAITNPKRTIRSIKRKMGSRYRVKIDDQKYSPEEISAMILQKLKDDGEDYLGEEIKQAVITVPAYFEDSQRQATKDAGKIAGLDVLRIINEPTAAALAYGLEKEEEQTILVYDLGGGTFDVSILEIGEGVFEVKATSGNNHLGGDDFDQAIMDWLMENFHKESDIEISEDRAALQRLKDASEKAKIELSGRSSTNINLPYLAVDDKGKPKHLEITLTRAKFESLIDDLIKKTIGPTKRALKDSGLKPEQIDKIILVGGSTRVPSVQRAIKSMLGKDPTKGINPEECVSIGAAIQAGVLTGEIKDVLLLDVTPLSLGVETLGGLTTKLIQRNTTIPTQKKQIFSTAQDNQDSVEVHVVQGEREMAGDNKTLGRFHLIGIPPAPRGIPQIEVTFDIDANGIVNVSARDLATNKKQSITISGTGTLSRNEVSQMIGDADKFSKLDKKKKKEAELRNQADALIYNTEKAIDEVGEKLNTEQLKSTQKALKDTKKALEGTNVTEIRKMVEILNQESQELFTTLYAEAARRELEEEEEEIEGEEDEDEEYKPISVPCPKCKAKIIVTSPKRPIEIKCPKCGIKGMLKAGKKEKEQKEKEKKKGAEVKAEDKDEILEKEKKKVKAKPPTELEPVDDLDELEELEELDEMEVDKEKKEIKSKTEKEMKKKEEYKPISISCPKCGNKIKVTSEERPITIKCSKCGAKGTIKGDRKKEKKEKKRLVDDGKEEKDESEIKEKYKEKQKKPKSPKEETDREIPKKKMVKEKNRAFKGKKKVSTVELGGKDEKVITLPDEGEGGEIFHEPREGIWQPSDKELKFDEEEVEKEREKEDTEPEPDHELIKKRPKKSDRVTMIKGPKGTKPESKPKIIKCKCGGKIVVDSPKRPIRIQCPRCGKKGMLKK